jgi:glycosyltransferase involved in cell wall biosynthesis
MKLLHVLPSVDPRGGGPMEGVRQRGLRLLEMGHEVDLLTLDDPQSPWVIDHPLIVHAIGPTTGRYRYNSRLVPWLQAHANEYDMVVINGLWQYHSFGTWRALRAMGQPYVVFTHGMLDPWFKRTYPLKHLKKWLYWPWADYRVLRDAAAVLFTSEDERRLARESFWLYSAREQVVSYGTRTPPIHSAALVEGFLEKNPALRGKRVLLFLSRIQEKKGCDLLIDAFADVVNQPGQDERLHLVIAGPDQEGWMHALEAQVQHHGLTHRIHWPGMLQGDIKWGAFHAAEAFVLPSHQENFGIAVAEALGCGLPVLISDKVNIWREIEADAAGFVAPDTLAGTRTTLQRWLALDAPARAAMATRARQSFDTRYTVSAMATSLLSVIGELPCRPVQSTPTSNTS